MNFLSEQSLGMLLSWLKEPDSIFYGSVGRLILLYLLFSILFFLIPIVIAYFRKHRNLAAIVVMCSVPFIAVVLMLLGVSRIASTENATGYAFLVWTIALVWSVSKPLNIEVKITNKLRLRKEDEK